MEDRLPDGGRGGVREQERIPERGREVDSDRGRGVLAPSNQRIRFLGHQAPEVVG